MPAREGESFGVVGKVKILTLIGRQIQELFEVMPLVRHENGRGWGIDGVQWQQ